MSSSTSSDSVSPSASSSISFVSSLSDIPVSASHPSEGSSFCSTAANHTNASSVVSSNVRRKRSSVTTQSSHTADSLPPKRYKGSVNGDSLINKLTLDELRSTLQGYLDDYNVDTDEQGCKRLGTKKSTNKTLARKSDGYLQVCVRGVSKETNSARYIELFGGLDKQIIKVLIHQVAWRVEHEDLIPDAKQICHTCSSTDCFNADHLVCGSRVLNESHKLCKYVYIKDNVSGNNSTFLLCPHEPKCHPPLKAYPLQPVSPKASMEFLTEASHVEPVNTRSPRAGTTKAKQRQSSSSSSSNSQLSMNQYFQFDKSSPLTHCSSH